MTEKGMVVTPQPEATEAGRDILAAGGNAIDAAIATALVQAVVDPLMCGIAGFGSLASRRHSKPMPKRIAITENSLGPNCSTPPSPTPKAAGTFDRTSIRSGPKKG